MQRPSFVGAALLLALVVLPVPALAQACGDSRLALQVLGSGGPVPSERASTGYLLWRNGRSVALFDAGGGVFQRFGQAGGRIADLRLVGISHLHPDHSSDLPALLWLTQFRTEMLPLAGPSGSADFPAFDVFMDRLIGPTGSAWPVAASRSAPQQRIVVDAGAARATTVYAEAGLTITARGVRHGAPSLAFRIDVDGVALVLGSDQTGADPAFVEFAKDADLLVMHLALSPDARFDSEAGSVHATPRVVGETAAASGADTLVLSHIIVPRADDPAAAIFSGRNRETLLSSVQAVRIAYGGQIAVAEDLQCIVLSR